METHNIIFGKDEEEIFENFFDYMKKKWCFSDSYVKNAFLILLAHASLEKEIEQIIVYLLRSKDDVNSTKPKKKLDLSRLGFKRKINILKQELHKLHIFKKENPLIINLYNFNTTRNAFAHLKNTGHEDYRKFVPSYDPSKKILSMCYYNKIEQLSNGLEDIKNNATNK